MFRSTTATSRVVRTIPSKSHDIWFLTLSPAFSSFSDLVLALFPILIIKDLQIEMKLKVALCSVMGMGIVATAAAIVKTVELKNLSTPDFTYNAVSLIYWYISENWLIVIAACIPTLGPLYFVLMGKRTAESFAVPSKPGAGRRGGSWKWAGVRSWRFQSPITRSKASKSSGSDGMSSMEKGMMSPGASLATPKMSSYGSSFHSAQRSVDESSERELVQNKDGRTSANIVKTTHVSVV